MDRGGILGSTDSPDMQVMPAFDLRKGFDFLLNVFQMYRRWNGIDGEKQTFLQLAKGGKQDDCGNEQTDD